VGRWVDEWKWVDTLYAVSIQPHDWQCITGRIVEPDVHSIGE